MRNITIDDNKIKINKNITLEELKKIKNNINKNSKNMVIINKLKKGVFRWSSL